MLLDRLIACLLSLVLRLRLLFCCVLEASFSLRGVGNCVFARAKFVLSFVN